MRTLMAALLAGTAGFGGAMGYNHYYAAPPAADSSAALAVLHDDLVQAYTVQLAYLGAIKRLEDINEAAWQQSQADRQQAQGVQRRWSNDLRQFNATVK